MAGFKKQIKAFTILETLIALVLLAVVVLMGASLFNIVNKWYVNYIGKTDNLTEVTTVYTQLKWDVQSSNSYIFDKNKLYLYKYPDQSKYSWFIESNKICRVNVIDTLKYELDGFFSIESSTIALNDNSGSNIFLIQIPQHCRNLNDEF